MKWPLTGSEKPIKGHFCSFLVSNIFCYPHFLPFCEISSCSSHSRLFFASCELPFAMNRTRKQNLHFFNKNTVGLVRVVSKGLACKWVNRKPDNPGNLGTPCSASQRFLTSPIRWPRSRKGKVRWLVGNTAYAQPSTCRPMSACHIRCSCLSLILDLERVRSLVHVQRNRETARITLCFAAVAVSRGLRMT